MKVLKVHRDHRQPENNLRIAENDDLPEIQPNGMELWRSLDTPTSNRRTVFFDLDNTLYSKKAGIHNQMAERIQLFMQEKLNLPEEESRRLGANYYLDYGLAIRGILNDFHIDPSDYDQFVDGGLDLSRLRPSDGLKSWLSSINASRWIFTNAGIIHARRVMDLLEITDLFEGIIYCDYSETEFPAKPERMAYERAMKWARVKEPGLCYFIDDSANNVRVASELGWKAVHFDEENDSQQSCIQNICFPNIKNILDMTNVFPELLEADESTDCRLRIAKSEVCKILVQNKS